MSLANRAARTVKRRTRDQLLGHRAAGFRIWVPDGGVTPHTMDMLEEGVKACGVSRRVPYSAQCYDCENFADSLKARYHEWSAQTWETKHGPAFGVAYGRFGGGWNAVNITMLDDLKIYFVEPQQRFSVWRPRRGVDRLITKIDF